MCGEGDEAVPAGLDGDGFVGIEGATGGGGGEVGPSRGNGAVA